MQGNAPWLCEYHWRRCVCNTAIPLAEALGCLLPQVLPAYLVEPVLNISYWKQYMLQPVSGYVIHSHLHKDPQWMRELKYASWQLSPAGLCSAVQGY